MNEEINKALNLSSMKETINNQTSILKEKYKIDVLYAENGGIFKVNAELIVLVCLLIELKQNPLFLIDSREIPILIEDPEKFSKSILDIHMRSTMKYYYEYEKLKKQRNLKTFLGIEDE